MNPASGGGAALDATVVVDQQDLSPEEEERARRKAETAAEFRRREIAWADENVAAAKRALSKARAAVLGAALAVRQATAQRRGLD